MSDKAKSISEAELVVPTLQELAKLPDRWLPINELVDRLIVVMKPTVENIEVVESRNENRFSQIVRNMVSQKTAEGNIIRKGYAVFMDNRLKITENGLAFLKRKIG